MRIFLGLSKSRVMYREGGRVAKSELREELEVLGVQRWLYHRFIYRHLMALAHQYGWHYAPKSVIGGGDTLEWCHWCGMRNITRNPEHVVSALQRFPNVARSATVDALREDA